MNYLGIYLLGTYQAISLSLCCQSYKGIGLYGYLLLNLAKVGSIAELPVQPYSKEPGILCGREICSP